MTARTEDLKTFARRQPVKNLALALIALNAGTEPDEAARLARAVIIDVLVEKSAAAAAEFHKLAESDLEPGEFDAMILAALGEAS